MGDANVIYARIFIDQNGRPAFYGLDEGECRSMCGGGKVGPPLGMRAPDDAEIAAFREKYGYTHVCGNVFMHVRRRDSAEEDDAGGLLARMVENFLHYMGEGLGIMLKGPPKFTRL